MSSCNGVCFRGMCMCGSRCVGFVWLDEMPSLVLVNFRPHNIALIKLQLYDLKKILWLEP